MAIINKRETYGAPYEDFHVGDVIKHWPGKTISESDNNLFCAITRNEHPLHLDAEYMKSHQHGQLLVVGTLVFSLIVGMTVRDISGQAVANLEYESITHDAPVFISDTVHAETEVLDKRETSKGNRGIVYVETRGYNQRQEKVLTLRRRFLCMKRES
ncbi:MAG: Acyl dehydratase [Chloroflexi bacterium]|jgi:acyl dehydratase|nr:MAG: Acyl dehydratase [Chloroflexota bacterium]